VRKMGGLRKFMPLTFVVYSVGMLALSGFPLLFSGFWSKDEILHQAKNWPISHIPFYLGVIGALFTAFYMTRQMGLVFFGNYRGHEEESAHGHSAHSHSHSSESAHSHDPHESPPVMTVPLIILASLAILLGFVGTPAWPWFDGYLTGEHTTFNFSRLTESGTLTLMVSSALVVFAGLGLGWFFYFRRQRKTVGEKDVLEAAQPALFGLLQNKYFVDEFYEATVIRFNAFAAGLCDFFDKWIFGGAVMLVSYTTLGFAWLYRLMDEYLVNLGFDTGCESLRDSGGGLSKLHTGRVQTYLRVIGVALVVLILFLIWGRKA
jgi:NADH-quinone oxidoreductase subunit L